MIIWLIVKGPILQKENKIKKNICNNLTSYPVTPQLKKKKACSLKAGAGN